MERHEGAPAVRKTASPRSFRMGDCTAYNHTEPLKVATEI